MNPKPLFPLELQNLSKSVQNPDKSVRYLSLLIPPKNKPTHFQSRTRAKNRTQSVHYACTKMASLTTWQR